MNKSIPGLWVCVFLLLFVVGCLLAVGGDLTRRVEILERRVDDRGSD